MLYVLARDQRSLSLCICFAGKYLYIESSHPSEKNNTAQLKSLLLPPAGEKGYCFTFWYHMFGDTVGSLKMFLKSADSLNKILVKLKINV